VSVFNMPCEFGNIPGNKKFTKQDLCCSMPQYSHIFSIFIIRLWPLQVKQYIYGDRLRVAVIQGNIPQEQKWDINFRDYILNRYENLTREAAKKRADLIVWPETSVPGFFEEEKDLRDRIEALAVSIETPILAGAVSEEKI